MTVNLPDRIFTIGVTLTPSNPAAILYSPTSVVIDGVQVNYNGFITTLRLSAIIASMTQMVLPAPDPAATPAELQLLAQQIKSQPRKSINLYLRKTSDPSPAVISGVDEIFIGTISVYPNKPFYMSGVNEYLSDLEMYSIQYGWQLIARATSDAGYGNIQGGDKIWIHGAAIERTGVLLRSDLVPINVVE